MELLLKSINILPTIYLHENNKNVNLRINKLLEIKIHGIILIVQKD